MISNKSLFLLLLALILIASASLWLIKEEGTKCMNDPIRYTLDILEKQAQANVTCSCTGGRYSSVFNKEGSVILDVKQTPSSYDTINYSELAQRIPSN